MNYTQKSLVERNLERACELLAVEVLANGGEKEMNSFGDDLHNALEEAIHRTLKRMDQRIRINDALKNPKIAN